MVYSVTFAPSIDYRLSLGDKPIRIGGVNRPFAREEKLGGKGITVSVMLANLGVETSPIVAVGGSIGQRIKEMVGRFFPGDKAIYLEAESESRINVVVLADTDTRFDPSAPKIKDEELQRLMGFLKSQLKSDDILVLSGSIAQEKATIYADIMREVANPIGCPVIVDCTGEALTYAIAEHPALIKPNDEELGDILGRKIATDDDIINGGMELVKKGPKNVVVSMGGRGSYFFGGDGSVYHISVAKGYPFINPVGTGDSSIAGYIKGLVEKRPLVDCLRLMAAAGGATAFSRGFGSLALTEELYKQIVVTKIR